MIDELADERLLHGRFDAARVRARTASSATPPGQRTGEADEEALLDTLRRAHHAEVFRTLVRDVEGELTVEQVADDLSALADAVLRVHRCAGPGQRLKQRHRETPQLRRHRLRQARRQGAGLRQRPGHRLRLRRRRRATRTAREVYAAFVRKLITWLTLRTAAGDLFDIDTALRPNGNSGLLVTSIEAFEHYQRGRGSNTAWTWEHQAMTRARFCAGTPRRWRARFEAVRRGGAHRAARRARRCATRSSRCARRCARRIRSRPAASTSSTAPAA